MTTDRFRSLDPLEPPDRWDDVLLRSESIDLAATADLGSAASPWQTARLRIVAAAAAVVVLLLVSVTAFGADGANEDTLRADQPGDPNRTTEPATTPSTESAPETTQTAAAESTVPSTTSPVELDDTSPPTTSDAAVPPTGPAPTSHPAPNPVVPHPTTPQPETPRPIHPSSVLGGPCPAYMDHNTATLRSGPSPVWSVASSTIGDGSTSAPDGSWPPQVVAHGEANVFRPGLTFEIGMGIGAPTDSPLPVIDLSNHLVRHPRNRVISGEERTPWPGTGYAGTPSAPKPGTPPERALHLPPAPQGHVTMVAVLSMGHHPNPACDDIYIAVTADPDEIMIPADQFDTALITLAKALRAGSPPA